MELNDLLVTAKEKKTSYTSLRNAVYALGFATSLENAEEVLEENGFVKSPRSHRNFDDSAIGFLVEKPRTSKELYEYFVENATPNKIRFIGLFEKIRVGVNTLSEEINEELPSKDLLEEANRIAKSTIGSKS